MLVPPPEAPGARSLAGATLQIPQLYTELFGCIFRRNFFALSYYVAIHANTIYCKVVLYQCSDIVLPEHYALDMI